LFRDERATPMTTTECKPRIRFGIPSQTSRGCLGGRTDDLERRGLVLLRQQDEQLGSLRECWHSPGRSSRSAVHPARATGAATSARVADRHGYEDQNDATALRRDPGVEGGLRPQRRRRRCPELTAFRWSRFEHAMTARAVVELTGAFEDEYVATLPGDTREIVLDLDSTEDPTHGQQPLSFFNVLTTTATCTSRCWCSTARVDWPASGCVPETRATPGTQRR